MQINRGFQINIDSVVLDSLTFIFWFHCMRLGDKNQRSVVKDTELARDLISSDKGPVHIPLYSRLRHTLSHLSVHVYV